MVATAGGAQPVVAVLQFKVARNAAGDHVEGRPDLALNEVPVGRARQVGVAERNHRKPDFDR